VASLVGAPRGVFTSPSRASPLGLRAARSSPDGHVAGNQAGSAEMVQPAVRRRTRLRSARVIAELISLPACA
jgi:hypothetical protein